MDTAQPCPLCSRSSEAMVSVRVCGECNEGIENAGQWPVAQTGEFVAMSIQDSGSTMSPDKVPMQSDAGEGKICSWCDKMDIEVARIISRQDHHICNECVALFAAVLSDTSEGRST